MGGHTLRRYECVVMIVYIVYVLVLKLVYSKITQRLVFVGDPHISAVSKIIPPAVLYKPRSVVLRLVYEVLRRIIIVPAYYYYRVIG